MRLPRERRLRIALFVGTGLASVALTLVAYGFGVFDELELQSVDARFSIRGERPAPKDIVIVRIDDETLSDTRLPEWPFPRNVHAKAIDRIAADRPAAIAYDLEFSQNRDEAGDRALAAALHRHRGLVVVSATATNDEGEPPLMTDPATGKPVETLVGSANFRLDRGNVYRRLPYEIEGLRGFAIVVAQVALHRRIRESELGGPNAWIDFAGPPRTIDSVSFSELAGGEVRRGRFAGKIVVIGATAPILQDIHAAATGPAMSGPEVEANAIWTAVHGFPLHTLPTWMNVFLIVLLGLLPAALGLLLRPAFSLAAMLLAAGLFVVAVQAAFEQGWIVLFVYPLAAVGLALVGALFAQYALASFERERVRDVFARFVPETVVDSVLAQAEGDLRLGGRKADATVVFADLRDFTPSAEKLEAEAVIDVLNQYLGAMSEAILEHGGTLVSYEGDGILAVFGAPIEQLDHADRALAAAREMLGVRLREFNDWVRQRDLGDGYRMGIGLNSGPVMTGNVGHERRVEYTAVGDTVNTASRIEELTKGSPFSILVADSTVQGLSAPASDLTLHGEVAIRGRLQKLVLWGLEPDRSANGESVAVADDGAPAP